MQKKASSFLNGSLSLNPWFLFFIFFISNLLLSYFSFSNESQLWIGCLGIGVPLIAGFKIAYSEKNLFKKSIVFDKKLFDPPVILWVLFIILLLLTRFYRLTTLPLWPLADEAQIGLLGMDQSCHWHWNLLWAESRVEPMAFWIMGLYFKLIEPSFFSLRLLPALFSITVPLAGYWAARQYFSKLTSFFFCWLMGFSFWELTLSRLLSTVMLVPLFQCLCFALLGIFISPSDLRYKWKNLVFLSLLSGIGFYTWTNWISIWLSIAAVLFIIFYLNKPKNKKIFVIFSALSLLTIVPLLLARLAPGGMSHIQGVGTSPSLKSLLLYLQGIFWNGIISFPYGSNWGGFFNPLLDTLILMGILYLFQTAEKKFIFLIMICVFFPLLLVSVTRSVELYRILPLFPFLTLSAALGIRGLIPDSRNLFSLGLIALCLLSSFGLDTYNYIFHYSNFQHIPTAQKWRSLEHLHAFQILEKQSEPSGSIYIFSEFLTDYDGRTLNMVDYPIDALQNPRLSQTHPQWAAVLDNIDYAPFFIKHFPGLKYEQLAQNNSLGLFLIPTAQMPAEELKAWIQADQIYRQVNLNVKNKNPLYPWGKFPEQFSALQNLYSHDRFLNSVYWEKLGSFKVMDGDFATAARAYKNAFQKGYPAAHLYHNEILALRLIGKIGRREPH